jgi:MFS family permease
MSAPVPDSVDDPIEILKRSPMSLMQWATVAVMFGLNALDGFDALAISFAAPGILAEWGLTRAELGTVMSMELVGMTIGSLMLGGVADSRGRRWAILLCLACMSIGMFGSALALSVIMLSVGRILTGFGIGGMLAATTAGVAEAANARRRPLVVVLMAAGFPIGSVLGGMVAVQVLRAYSWHEVFLFGAICTTVMVPLVLWLAPDSIEFEIHRRGHAALPRINRLLTRMGHAPLAALRISEPPADERKAGLAEIFAPALRWTTILLTIAYLANITTFHFLFKWTAQAVADMGFSAPQAGSVLVWASSGGIVGCLLFGWLSARISVLHLTIAIAALASLAVAIFGALPPHLPVLSAGAFAAGFCTNAAVVGHYSLAAMLFPTRVRAGATGVVIGVGRGAAAAAPVLAGILFTAGYGFSIVAIVMGSGSAICAVTLAVLRARLRRVSR